MTTRFAIACLLCFASISAAGTIGVPGDYATIQEALDASVAGDVIEVAPGTYTGSGDAVVTMPSHPVTLRSIGGAEVTVIDAENVRRGMVIQQADPVQWRTEDGGNGHWYQAVNNVDVLCWAEARDRAFASGGHLATLTDSAENSWIKNGIASDPALWADAWGTATAGPFFGGFSSSLEFSWVTDEDWSFTDWRPGNPNPDNQNSCTILFGLNLGNYGWNNINLDGCEVVHSFIVEWTADCNGDGIVDYGQILDGTFEDENGDGVPDTCVCPADLDEDLLVSVNDLLIVIAQWGSSTSLGDINNDGMTNVDDLLLVIQSWGACL